MAVVTGIGVNVVAAPQGVPYAAISLDEAGFALSAAQVFARLSDAWAEARAALGSRAGACRNLRKRWLSLRRRCRRAGDGPGRRPHRRPAHSRPSMTAAT